MDKKPSTWADVGKGDLKTPLHVLMLFLTLLVIRGKPITS